MTFAEFRAEHSDGVAAKGDMLPTDIYTAPSSDARVAQEYPESLFPDAAEAEPEYPTENTDDTDDKNPSAPAQSAADTDNGRGEGKAHGGTDGRGLILEYYDEQLVARAGAPEREPGIFDRIPFLRTKRG